MMAASYEKDLIKDAVEKLSVGKGTGLVLLKITYCNAHLHRSFTQSYCEVAPEPKSLFYFLSIFRRGTEVLKSLFSDSMEKVKTSCTEELAVQRLLRFLDKIGAYGRQLASRRSKTECQWTLQLCKHLLQELGSEEFIVDELSRDLGQVGSLEDRVCPCCPERLIGGSTDNTYIGSSKVWHGRLDVALLGRSGNIELPVRVETDLDIENGKKTLVGRAQCLAQCIVFAHYIRRKCPKLRNFLIPTITITRNQVLFTFYDPTEKMLIQSESMYLFEDSCEDDANTYNTSEQLKIDTIVALWLVLNYKLFCSGVCLDMKETEYTADFLRDKPDILNIYNNELKFGITIESEELQSFACTKDGVYMRVVKGDK